MLFWNFIGLVVEAGFAALNGDGMDGTRVRTCTETLSCLSLPGQLSILLRGLAASFAVHAMLSEIS